MYNVLTLPQFFKVVEPIVWPIAYTNWPSPYKVYKEANPFLVFLIVFLKITAYQDPEGQMFRGDKNGFSKDLLELFKCYSVANLDSNMSEL